MEPPQMMGYDRAITVFSPQGRLYQVEYAREAVKKGTISIGIVYADGTLLIADRNVTEKLMIPESVEKIYQIDEHIGAATAGLVADGRIIIERARIIAQSHRITYDEPMSTEALTREICDYKQMHTQLAGARPFGTALLIGGINNGRGYLFETDPSGSYWGYNATAIGEGVEKVKDIISRGYKNNLTLDQAINLALKALYTGTKERFSESSIEIAYINKTKDYVKLSTEEIKKYILQTIKNVSKKKK